MGRTSRSWRPRARGEVLYAPKQCSRPCLARSPHQIQSKIVLCKFLTQSPLKVLECKNGPPGWQASMLRDRSQVRTQTRSRLTGLTDPLLALQPMLENSPDRRTRLELWEANGL